MCSPSRRPPAGARGGLQGELAGGLVERRGHRDDHLLLREAPFGAVVVIPGLGDVLEDERGRLHRREPRPVLHPPGQDGGVAIDAGMTEPRLGRRDHPARLARALAAGELAHHAAAGGVPGQRGVARAEIVLAGQVDEGGELGAAVDGARRHELRHLERLHALLGGARVHVRHRGVGGAEVHPDDEAR
jgi:hypothetical protein